MALGAAAGAGAEEAAPTDYLTFAQGAVPIRVTVPAARKPLGFSEALRAIDGDPRGFSFVSGVGREIAAELVFALPAPTTFDRFAVPGVFETPSPGQTFFKNIRIEGSAGSPDGPWQDLAAGELSLPDEPGGSADLRPVATPAVRWVRVSLSGGLDVGRDLMAYEFSEIVGNGSQEPALLSRAFDGIWKDRGVLIELRQKDAVVAGCVDDDGDPFEGTVSGSILRGRAVDRRSGVVSLFILAVADGRIRGVRSTNGAPFALYEGGAAPSGITTDCSAAPAPALGCGSILHGINFAVDSATIRPDSEPILDQLHAGLAAGDARVRIEGHTSSEGSTAYNQSLSERRAQAVVDALVKRGIDAGRLSAVGRGEESPFAANDTESGRALNRRVEIHCDDAG